MSGVGLGSIGEVLSIPLLLIGAALTFVVTFGGTLLRWTWYACCLIALAIGLTAAYAWAVLQLNPSLQSGLSPDFATQFGVALPRLIVSAPSFVLAWKAISRSEDPFRGFRLVARYVVRLKSSSAGIHILALMGSAIVVLWFGFGLRQQIWYPYSTYTAAREENKWFDTVATAAEQGRSRYDNWKRHRDNDGGADGTAVPPVVATAMRDLNVRSTPSSNSDQVGYVTQGARVLIVCTAYGESVVGPSGSSALWNKLASPSGFVADAFVDTGSNLPVAPECAS
jgi:hypothetical protein